VLYIDDLDRCPPDRVVEVLEAVHLLLAVPLFVIVVAVDPRWLLRAIGVHYREVFSSGTAGGTPSSTGPGSFGEVDPGDQQYWTSTPAQYLEKIFQVIFTLPAMTPGGYKSLLDSVIGAREDIDMSEVSAMLFDEPQPHAARNGLDAAPGNVIEDEELVRSALQHRARPDADMTAVPSATSDDVSGTVELPKPPVVHLVDPLALNGAELTLIRLLGPTLIGTPRAVKRLANSYGLLAAIHRLNDPADTSAPLPAMILLAALVGCPSLGPALLKHLRRAAIKDRDMAWKTFLEELDTLPQWSNADVLITDAEKENRCALAGALKRTTERAGKKAIALPEAISEWDRWIELVGRLSFPAGSVVGRLSRLNASD